MTMIFVLLVMAVIYLPILLLVFLSFSEGLQYYTELFTNQHYMQAVGNTLLIAVVASLIATIIATMAATGIIYMKKKTKAVTMAINQLPIINADIVTSFSLVLLFVGLGFANFGLFKLILAHVLIALPFCLLTILPKIRQLDVNLIDAALDLGASPFKAFTSVIVPQLVPAMIQAFLLGFTLSLDDFVITQYNNSGVPTISTVVYGAISRRDIPNAFKALTTIIFVVILVILVIMNFNSARQRSGKKLNKRIVAFITAAVILLSSLTIIPIVVNNMTPRSSVLKVYNWEDYINTTDEDDDIDLIAKFEEKYRREHNDPKFRVEYHTFTDNEELYSKIKTQEADYDVIFPSEYMVEKMAKQGLLKTIDTTKIDAITDGTLNDAIMERAYDFAAVRDAANNIIANQLWSIPYMVGTVGIMYDTDVIDMMYNQGQIGDIDSEKFEEILEDVGFGVLFGEAGTDVFKGHITMKKSARDSIGIAMLYAKQAEIKASIQANRLTGDDYDNSMLSNILNMEGDGNTLELARQTLENQITKMNPTYENDTGKKSFLDKNDTRFAYGLFWSCDAGLTMGANLDANKDQLENLKFYAPEGTNLWTDNFALPVYGQNESAAYEFINFMLDPENACDNIDYVGSQMPVAGEEVDAMKEDYGLITDPTDEDFGNIFYFDNNYVNTIFPDADSIKYSAIMHNFKTDQIESAVNDLMVNIQNKAAQLAEAEGTRTPNIFLIMLGIMALGAAGAAIVYIITHRRPH